MAYPGLSGLVWACLGLSRLVQACPGLSWLFQTCQACPGLSWLLRACPGLSGVVRACLGLSGFKFKSSSSARAKKSGLVPPLAPKHSQQCKGRQRYLVDKHFSMMTSSWELNSESGAEAKQTNLYYLLISNEMNWNVEWVQLYLCIFSSRRLIVLKSWISHIHSS